MNAKIPNEIAFILIAMQGVLILYALEILWATRPRSRKPHRPDPLDTRGPCHIIATDTGITIWREEQLVVTMNSESIRPGMLVRLIAPDGSTIGVEASPGNVILETATWSELVERIGLELEP